MAAYWLVPVEKEDPLVLGGDRFRIPSGPEGDTFRERLTGRLPARLLPMVKAHILPADPEEGDAACGSEVEPDLSAPGPIRFDAGGAALSHCGRAFIDRLPAAGLQETALQALLEEGSGCWNEQERDWLLRVRSWATVGWSTMLVKEEG